MNESEYTEHLNTLLAELAQGRYVTPAQLAARMLPGHAGNAVVLKALKNLKGGITARQLEAALAAKARAEAAVEAAAARDAKTREILNSNPTTERQMVDAYLKKNGYVANFSGLIVRDGQIIDKAALLREIQLTAADLRLNHKPLELRDQNYGRALLEKLSERRIERLAEVLDLLDAPLSHAETMQVERDMLRRFQWLFQDPAYALASIQTVLWQIKRKMRNIEIADPLFTVLYGKQKTGKSSFWRRLFAPIRDLCKSVDVTDLVSEKHIDLFAFYVIDTDEMGKAAHACIAKLKNIVTREMINNRVYHTQSLADQPMCATLVGTSNVPLATIVQDNTGMRRFNEVAMRLSTAETRAHWDEAIGQADFIPLWRSIDANGEWPLAPFAERLAQQQEAMRTIDRVEAWLTQFTFKARIPASLHTPPPGFDAWPNTAVAYQAIDLFAQDFGPYEEKAFPGMRMAMNSWSLKLKALIQDGSAPEWQVQTHGRRTIYTYTPPANTIKTGTVVALRPV